MRLERSRLRLRIAFRLVSNSETGVGSMVGEPSAGRESAALHFTARPEASKAAAAALASERLQKPALLDKILFLSNPGANPARQPNEPKTTMEHLL